MRPDSSLELSKSSLLVAPQESALENYLHSAVYATIQTPLNGAAQLIDKAAGTELLPKVQFIEAPAYQGLASELGALTGTGIHCAAMLSVGHAIGGPLTNLNAGIKRAAICGGMGAAYGGVFTPAGSQENSTGERLQNTLNGAVGLAGMSGFLSLYKDVLAKDVKFMDVPHFYSILLPGSTLGIGVAADSMTNFGQQTGARGGVFMSRFKLQAIDNFAPPKR